MLGLVIFSFICFLHASFFFVGTGKTRVITFRVQYLLLHKKVPPHHIYVTTYSQKAAQELKERIGNAQVQIGTFHKIAKTVVDTYYTYLNRKKRPTICDEKSKRTFVATCLRDYYQDSDEQDKVPLDVMLGLIADYKNTKQLSTNEQFVKQAFFHVYNAYQKMVHCYMFVIIYRWKLKI